MLINNMSMADARRNFSDILHRAFYQDHVTTISRHGKPVAMLVPNKYREIIQAIQEIGQKGEPDSMDMERIVALIRREEKKAQRDVASGDNP